MSSEEVASLEEHKRELLEPATLLFSVQQTYGNQVREQTIKAYGHLADAHMLVSGVIGAVLLRNNGKVFPIVNTSEERNALFASFVIGMTTCEAALAEGRYLQALALLRQEMEIIAQIRAVCAGQRKENGAPNVRFLNDSISRMYGDLCAAAHVSKASIVRSATSWQGEGLPEGGYVTRYFPDFDECLARRSFGLHLVLIFGLIDEIHAYFQEHGDPLGFTDREIVALRLARHLMYIEGILEA